MSRKEEIINALGTMIESQGLQTDFTMSELARRVDIGKSTIYEYFSTKDELIGAAMNHLFHHAMDEMSKRELDPNASFEESLKSELRFSFELAKGGSYIFKLMTPDFRESIPMKVKGEFADIMRDTTKQYEQLFRQIIAKGLEEGILKPDNLEMKGVLFGSLVSGSVTHVTRAHNQQAIAVDVEEHIEAIYQTVLSIFNK